MHCLLIQIVAAHRLGIPHTDSAVAGSGELSEHRHAQHAASQEEVLF